MIQMANCNDEKADRDMRTEDDNRHFGGKMNNIKVIEYTSCEELLYEDLDNFLKYIEHKQGGRTHKIFINNIEYICADGKYTRIYQHGNREYIFSNVGITRYEKELERNFVRSHRGYLVNLMHVKSIDEDILLYSGERVPVSRRLKATVKEKHGRYRCS